MITIIGILIAILIFGILIFIHELGHFTAAKAFKMRVYEFSVGMGPKLFSKVRKDTRYSLRLLPIGGYVSLGEDDIEGTNDPNSFCNRPIWQRAIVLVAGAVMNLLLGLVILIIMFAPQKSFASTTISKFSDDSSSYFSKLEIGDRITKINNSSVLCDSDITFNLLRDEDGVVDITVVRNGEKVRIDGISFPTEEIDGKLYIKEIGFKVEPIKNNVFTTIGHSVKWGISITKTVWMSLIDLITGHVGISQLSGPVGTTTVIGDAVKQGFTQVLTISSFITINLGIFNLLPIPALDGGRLLFLLFEAIFRKPMNKKVEASINATFLLLLLLLIAVVTFNDVAKLIHK